MPFLLGHGRFENAAHALAPDDATGLLTIDQAEELWRSLKATVAANRCYASLEDLAERAMAWLDGMSDAERRRRCGLTSSKFAWLPT